MQTLVASGVPGAPEWSLTCCHQLRLNSSCYISAGLVISTLSAMPWKAAFVLSYVVLFRPTAHSYRRIRTAIDSKLLVLVEPTEWLYRSLFFDSSMKSFTCLDLCMCRFAANQPFTWIHMIHVHPGAAWNVSPGRDTFQSAHVLVDRIQTSLHSSPRSWAFDSSPDMVPWSRG